MSRQALHARLADVRIPVFANRRRVAELRPVSITIQDVKLLTEWRNNNRESFFTWFLATKEGTKKWLEEQVVVRQDRVLFMIEANGVPFGHIGLCNIDPNSRSCEVDNVLRGRSGILPGGITLAIRALLKWIEEYLGIVNFQLRVFSDNRQAISIYKRCGFVVVGRVPLHRVEKGDITRWVELRQAQTKKAKRFATYMSLKHA